jgi:hypothetical protein
MWARGKGEGRCVPCVSAAWVQSEQGEGPGESVEAAGVDHKKRNATCAGTTVCSRSERALQARSEGGVCKTARGQVCAKLQPREGKGVGRGRQRAERARGGGGAAVCAGERGRGRVEGPGEGGKAVRGAAGGEI